MLRFSSTWPAFPAKKPYMSLDEFLKKPFPENVDKLNLQEKLTIGPYKGCSILFRLVTDLSVIPCLQIILENLSKEQWLTFDTQAKAQDGTNLMWWLILHHRETLRLGENKPDVPEEIRQRFYYLNKCLELCLQHLTKEQWQKIDLEAKPDVGTKSLFDYLHNIIHADDGGDGDWYYSVFKAIVANKDASEMAKRYGIRILEISSLHKCTKVTDKILKHLSVEDWSYLDENNCEKHIDKYINKNRWLNTRKFYVELNALKRQHNAKDLQVGIQLLFDLAKKAQLDGHLQIYIALGDYLREIGDYANAQTAYQQIFYHQQSLKNDANLNLAELYFTGNLTFDSETTTLGALETSQAKQQRLLKAYEYVSKVASDEHFVICLRDNILTAYLYGATIYNPQLHPLVRAFTDSESKDPTSLSHFTALQAALRENQALKKEIDEMKANMNHMKYPRLLDAKTVSKLDEPIMLEITSTEEHHPQSVQSQIADQIQEHKGRKRLQGSSEKRAGVTH